MDFLYNVIIIPPFHGMIIDQTVEIKQEQQTIVEKNNNNDTQSTYQCHSLLDSTQIITHRNLSQFENRYKIHVTAVNILSLGCEH